jgi:hypothetical protein
MPAFNISLATSGDLFVLICGRRRLTSPIISTANLMLCFTLSGKTTNAGESSSLIFFISNQFSDIFNFYELLWPLGQRIKKFILIPALKGGAIQAV